MVRGHTVYPISTISLSTLAVQAAVIVPLSHPILRRYRGRGAHAELDIRANDESLRPAVTQR
jgi:hypothetical protein